MKRPENGTPRWHKYADELGARIDRLLAELEETRKLKDEAETEANKWLREAQRQEREKEALREAAQKAINSYKSSSGYEPSISVFHRDLDALQAALDKGE